ncbi:MAG: hypothetical protein J5629_03200 [Muribaculaceae bacterium]|nr:hypothetical protein [Muribaculaceae bacterium]
MWPFIYGLLTVGAIIAIIAIAGMIVILVGGAIFFILFKIYEIYDDWQCNRNAPFKEATDLPQWLKKLKIKIKSNQKIIKIGGAVALLALLLYVFLPNKDDKSKEQNIEIVANQDNSTDGKLINKDSRVNEGEIAKASDRHIMVEVKRDAEIYDTKIAEESNQIYNVTIGNNYTVIADAGDYYIIGIEDIYGITNMAYIKKSYVSLK